MGWFDGRSSSSAAPSAPTHYFVRKKRSSPARRTTVYTTTHHPRHSAPSIFSFGSGITGGGRTRAASPSIFSSFSIPSSSSRRARPRDGFIRRVVQYIRRLFRDIWYYARRHPAKVFFLVIMPLITSGVIVKLLAMIGIRLPRGVFGGLAGGGGGGRGGGGGGGRYGYGYDGGFSTGGGVQESVNGLMSIAKMFM